MNTSTVRKEIHDYVDGADKRFLTLVHGMIKAEKQSLESPKQEMISRAQQSERDIAEGKTISASQFNADFQKWKKEKRESIK